MAGPMGRMGPRGFLTEEEKKSVPKVTKGLITRILGYLKPYWLQFIFVFITILLSSVVGLLPSIITGKIVDEALVGEDLSYLIQLLLMAFAALTVSQLVGVVENYINAWISQRIIYDMRNQMYNHLQYMPHSFFTTEKQGDIVTRMNTDISGVSSVISGTLSSVVSNIATVITTLVALFSMSWQLAIVGIVVIPLLVIPTRSAGKTRWSILSESQAKSDEMNQKIEETLSVSGSLLVKLFTREEKEYEDFVKVNKEVTDLNMKEQRSGQLFRVVMGMFTQVGPLLIYFAGGYLIIKHIDTSLTVGTITATVSLINRLYRPVESLMNLQVDFTRSLALFTRIFDYFDRESTIVSPENGRKPDVDNQPIKYDHVAFSYSEDAKILTDVNFEVPGGKMYAIVGPSGSGKSTVVNLIPRLYDVTAGSVSIAGVDVRDFDLKYLRQCIGVVSQETYLFNGTILENLQYANADATREDIETACKIANIHDVIMSFADGYDTEVGNRGLKLSGGEKQRISLARVILKDPKILILDEATSALDSISENAIQDALEKMMEGRTSIVIAHRLSTILKADQILVVNNGVIAEQGTHDELLELGGTYKELYETQFRIAIENEAERTGAGAEESDGIEGVNGAAASIDLNVLSTEYEVKKITESDISPVYWLAKSNHKYYESLGTFATRESLTEVVSSLPEGADIGSKHFVGFYDDDDRLIAVLDLITGYPEDDDAFIGWFMVDGEKQRQGIGSNIIADVRAAMKAAGYDKLSVICAEVNTDAIKFWQGQGFRLSGEELEVDGYKALTLVRDI